MANNEASRDTVCMTYGRLEESPRVCAARLWVTWTWWIVGGECMQHVEGGYHVFIDNESSNEEVEVVLFFEL